MTTTRSMLALAAAAAVGFTALPSQAAGHRTLYFDNHGKSSESTCTALYVLTPAAPTGAPCEGASVGVAGNGTFSDDVYAGSGLPRAVLDAHRPVTGTVYITNYPAFQAGLGPASTPTSLGGPAGATVEITVNGVTVGTASADGVTAPGAAVAIPVKLRLPASLDGKRLRSISASVQMTSGLLVTGVSYAKPARSRLVLPTR